LRAETEQGQPLASNELEATPKERDGFIFIVVSMLAPHVSHNYPAINSGLKETAA